MTLLEITQAIYRATGAADSPETAVKTRVKQSVNIWHRRLLTRFARLRDDTTTFATVANQAVYALPQTVAEIRGMSETTTPTFFETRSLEWIRRMDPQQTAVGPSWVWAEVSRRQTALNPSTTGVWVVSSAAGDTTQTAYIEGVRSDGERAGSISAALNGTTRVALGTFTDYVELDKAYVSGACAGTVTFYDAATNGNVLATITIGRTSAKYLWVRLYPIPKSAITISVDYTRQIDDMVQDTDEPLLPEDFQSILVEAGSMEEWLRKDDARAGTSKKLLDEQVRKLQHWVNNPPDYHPVVARKPTGYSRFGGAFPADAWRW